MWLSFFFHWKMALILKLVIFQLPRLITPRYIQMYSSPWLLKKPWLLVIFIRDPAPETDSEIPRYSLLLHHVLAKPIEHARYDMCYMCCGYNPFSGLNMFKPFCCTGWIQHVQATEANLSCLELTEHFKHFKHFPPQTCPVRKQLHPTVASVSSTVSFCFCFQMLVGMKLHDSNFGVNCPEVKV